MTATETCLFHSIWNPEKVCRRLTFDEKTGEGLLSSPCESARKMVFGSLLPEYQILPYEGECDVPGCNLGRHASLQIRVENAPDGYIALWLGSCGNAVWSKHKGVPF